MKSQAVAAVGWMVVLHVVFCGSTLQVCGETSEVEDPKMTNKLTEVRALPVKYVKCRDGRFAPAYVDEIKGVLYVWREVFLRVEQLPKATAYDRTPIIDVSNTPLDVRQVVPETRYAVIHDDLVGVGYYDRSNQIFFKWKGIQLAKESLVPDKYPALRVGVRRGEEIRRQEDIPIPDGILACLFNDEQ